MNTERSMMYEARDGEPCSDCNIPVGMRCAVCGVRNVGEPEAAIPKAILSKQREDKVLAALLRDFPLSFTEIARVLTHGAAKHGAHDWTFLTPREIEAYEHSADRHDLQRYAGNSLDESSNCYHEAMAITNRLIALELKLKHGMIWPMGITMGDKDD